MARVLVDNGLVINILFMTILEQLPVDKPLVRLSRMMVRIIDGVISEVISDIDIDLEIEPYIFFVSF